MKRADVRNGLKVIVKLGVGANSYPAVVEQAKARNDFMHPDEPDLVAIRLVGSKKLWFVRPRFLKVAE